MNNCPFYGYSHFSASDPKHTFPFILLQMDGNQCGLVTTSHAPCWMEMNRQPVEWKECPYMKELRISVISPVLKP
jgi:hypothetical protein